MALFSPFKRVTIVAEAIPISEAFITVIIERASILLSDITSPKEILKIGDRMGAINILPITTEALSIKRPKVAIKTESVTSIKKSKSGVLSVIRFFTAFDLSASVKLSICESNDIWTN
jgi:hypothetical protein